VPDLILLDLVMPERSGLDLLVELEDLALEIPVVVLSGTRTVATVVEAMKRGAIDYVTKPFEPDALRPKLARLIEQRELEHEVVRLRQALDRRERLGELVGASPPMQSLFDTLDRVAASDATVLVLGESGTGKELVARAIHSLSPRAEGPFVAVNCGAIPRELVESELFGHEKGAFTGADSKRIGRFEAASGGTLLLDEIGELPPEVQVKLLRVLQERSFERVGSSGRDPIQVDVRIVCATNRELEREVDEGRFRPDLYYRIAVVPVHVPALRDRRGDIALLTRDILEQLAPGRVPELADGVLAALEAYSWPGNVRELHNALERALALCEGDQIELRNLPETVERAGSEEALHDAWRSGQIGLDEALARFERRIISEALEQWSWNQTRAADALGITRRVLKLKIDRHKLGSAPS